MTTAQLLTIVVPTVALLCIAVWRFGRLEQAMKHQARCNRLLVKAVVKVYREVHKLKEG